MRTHFQPPSAPQVLQRLLTCHLRDGCENDTAASAEQVSAATDQSKEGDVGMGVLAANPDSGDVSLPRSPQPGEGGKDARSVEGAGGDGHGDEVTVTCHHVYTLSYS
eukprot:scaffold7997_cov126-Isochrysis_galbana.AAC.4